MCWGLLMLDLVLRCIHFIIIGITGIAVIAIAIYIYI